MRIYHPVIHSAEITVKIPTYSRAAAMGTAATEGAATLATEQTWSSNSCGSSSHYSNSHGAAVHGSSSHGTSSHRISRHRNIAAIFLWLTHRSQGKMLPCGGAPSVPTVFPASAVTWPIIPHTCCTYVDTRLSLPSLKYTVVAWLLSCLHLSTSGDPAFDFTRGHASQHVISTHVHVLEYKT
jgi:hypothetical protein